MRTVLLFLLAGLGGLLYVQWQIAPARAPGPMPPSTRPQAGGQDVQSTAADFAITLDEPGAFDVVSKRPLFVEGRRPPENAPPVEVPSVDQSTLKGLDLTAVLITPESTVAWVKDQKSGELVRLAPGRIIRGWTVKAVEPGMLMLAAGAQTAELELREFPAQAAPAAQPARRPQPQKKAPPRSPVRNRNLERKK